LKKNYLTKYPPPGSRQKEENKGIDRSEKFDEMFDFETIDDDMSYVKKQELKKVKT